MQDKDVSLLGLPEALELLAEISVDDQGRRWLKLVSMVKQRKPQEDNIGTDQGCGGGGGREGSKQMRTKASLVTPEDTLALGPLHPHYWKHISVQPLDGQLSVGLLCR